MRAACFVERNARGNVRRGRTGPTPLLIGTLRR
jgi:hypothetical protein